MDNISDCYYVRDDGEIINKVTGAKKSKTLGVRGYYYVSLNEKVSNRQVKVPVHKIIALAFIKNASYDVINHKDGNKQNNSIENLEFCSAQENCVHAWKTGLIVRAERIFKIQFSDESTLVGTMKQLHEETGIPKPTLYDLFYKRKGSEIHNIYKIVEVTDNKSQETIEMVTSA